MSSKRDNGIKFFEENPNLKEPVVTMFGVKTGDKYDKSHYVLVYSIFDHD